VEFQKSSPYAQFGWSDSACHTGNLQDTDCRSYNNTNPSTSKNLSGGWHDAGDYNKYVNFTFETMIDLLLAYKENPQMWGDDYNIPESGNGIPDLLDEAKYELDWLLKMQNSNGSVLSIVGVQNFGTASPPSADISQRLYGPATTSATFTASALFALGALQFNSIGQNDYANTLQVSLCECLELGCCKSVCNILQLRNNWSG
jgi:endoglucanase